MTMHETSRGSNGDPDGDSGVRAIRAGLSVGGQTVRPSGWSHGNAALLRVRLARNSDVGHAARSCERSIWANAIISE